MPHPDGTDPGPGAAPGPDGPGLPAAQPVPVVGTTVELEIGAVAHGGHCVARWDGRVVFVRYVLPGERARVRITEERTGYLRGDAVEILTADPDRVTPRCAHFGPGGCGGCDFQHVTTERQRALKAAVVAEQLARLAGLERTVEVEALPGDGFGWRTRVRWALDATGRIGPRAARSHEVVGVSSSAPCEIAAAGISPFAAAVGVPAEVREQRARPRRRGRGGDALPELTIVARSSGAPVAHWAGTPFDGELVEQAAGRDFRVAVDGFWQVHPAAAGTLAAAVGEALDTAGVTTAGARGWDLYGGVGLFAAVLADRVGDDGHVVTVESDAAATALAAENLAGSPVQAVTADVARWLPGAEQDVDLVVLDPPRSGAGRAVCEELARRGPALIVYVACDPAALARDTATLDSLGYRLDTLRAFDCFPQTHHVECVARFVPA